MKDNSSSPEVGWSSPGGFTILEGVCHVMGEYLDHGHGLYLGMGSSSGVTASLPISGVPSLQSVGRIEFQCLKHDPSLDPVDVIGPPTVVN